MRLDLSHTKRERSDNRMNGQNLELVSMNYYNPSQLFNRMGQLFYRTGEINKAKMLFLLSGIYDGKFKLENNLQ